MFPDYYGMKYNPFAKEQAGGGGYFTSRDHKEMLSRLNYLKDIRGIGVFTAQPGMGKTCSLRRFMQALNRNLYTPVYLCLSTVSITEFYRQLCDCIGTEPAFSKSTMFKEIQERIYYLYQDKKQPLVLAIDEAQYLNYTILRDLKMIMNQNYDSVNCFSLVLVGEPYLNHILEKQIHEALRQRIMVHYNFAGLTEEEVPEYIYHKIESAGSLIKEIQTMTNNFTLPSDACPTFAHTYALMQELFKDIFIHIFKENSIVFPEYYEKRK